jgi:hypothetical protein
MVNILYVSKIVSPCWLASMVIIYHLVAMEATIDPPSKWHGGGIMGLLYIYSGR